MPRQHGPIAGAHRILWGERDLDLPRRVLGVHLLHPNARALQVVYQVEEVISHVAEGGGPVAGATVDELHVSVPVLAPYRPLQLVAGLELKAHLGSLVQHAPQERALAPRPRPVLLVALVHGGPEPPRRAREGGRGPEVGDESYVPDRSRYARDLGEQVVAPRRPEHGGEAHAALGRPLQP